MSHLLSLTFCILLGDMLYLSPAETILFQKTTNNEFVGNVDVRNISSKAVTYKVICSTHICCSYLSFSDSIGFPSLASVCIKIKRIICIFDNVIFNFIIVWTQNQLSINNLPLQECYNELIFDDKTIRWWVERAQQ